MLLYARLLTRGLNPSTAGAASKGESTMARSAMSIQLYRVSFRVFKTVLVRVPVRLLKLKTLAGL